MRHPFFPAILVCSLASACSPQLRPDLQPMQVDLHGTVPACIVDTSLSIADSVRVACVHALARFHELLGRPAWPTSVLEVDSLATTSDIEDGRLVMKIGNQGRLDEMQRRSGRDVERMAVGDFVSHELGHFYLFMYMRSFGPDSTDGYSTALPDWIDEGFAIWHEFDSGRQRRYEMAATLPGSELNLFAVAYRRHPNLNGSPSIRRSHSAEYKFTPRDPSLCERDPGACDPHGLGGPHVRILTWIDTMDVLHVDTVFPNDPRFDWFNTGNYYTIVSTILPFLHKHGGSAAIREVILRAHAGATPTELFTNLPGLPPQPADVNRAWIEFVRSLARSTGI